MKSISFYGAAGTVTGSCYLLQKDNAPGILIDLGMYQGKSEISQLNQKPLQFDPRSLEGVLLTHAHLDHCGRLPLLSKNGFTKKVFMTEPTLDMLHVALMDAARIAQKDEKIPVIYTEEDVEVFLQLAEVVDFDQSFTLGGFEITYRDAGHILGAASIEIVDRQPDSDIRKIVFSGDIGRFPHNMLQSPHMFEESDVVIMESTYGGRKHPHDDAADILESEVKAAEASDGVLMLPCFAIQRTQEILYMLKGLKDSGKIKSDTPIYLDSPMAIKITEIYKRYGGLYNDDFHAALGKFDPFNFHGLKLLPKSKDGRIIDKTEGARVIIAGSGMMSGGRILKHARKFIAKEENRLLFLGYQGEETLGRAILEGKQQVDIQDATLPVRAHIGQVQSMSAHADESQLLQWLGHMNGVKKVFLTHGEDISREAIAPKVEDLGIQEVQMPRLDDEIKL